jgi:hypothetical protein
MAYKISTIQWKTTTVAQRIIKECLMISKKGVNRRDNLKDRNARRTEKKMMADVWCLMPLSTIFHLYFGGHTINGRQINALYYSYFSH